MHSVDGAARALSRGAIASFLVLGACSGSRPELLVIVESELPTATAIEVRTLDEAGAPIDMHRFDLGVTEVPFSFGVAARDRAQLGAHLELDALDAAGTLVATRTVRTQMHPTRRLVVVVRFTADCSPGPVCPEGETCVDGRCAPDWVEPHPEDDASMPAVDGSMPADDAGTMPVDAGTVDAGTDASIPAVDAGPDTCPSITCPCLGGRCTCAAFATCAWSDPGSTSMVCGANASCAYESGEWSSLRCDRDSECVGELGGSSDLTCTRASCDVSLGAGSTAVCDMRASCVIACTGACNVDCRMARSCVVTCAGASPRDAAGARTTCE